MCVHVFGPRLHACITTCVPVHPFTKWGQLTATRWGLKQGLKPLLPSPSRCALNDPPKGLSLQVLHLATEFLSDLAHLARVSVCGGWCVCVWGGGGGR
jgi:hypothetical protein